MVTIRFYNVGSGLAEWVVKLEEFKAYDVLMELRRRKGERILERAPDVMLDEVAGRGSIWYGGKVFAGRFEVVE